MAQHGDLQLPIIDARSDEQAEEAAQDAIQEEREHGPSLIDSQASRQRRTSTARSNLFTPHAEGTSSSSYAWASDKRVFPFTARCAVASLSGHGSEPHASAASDVARPRAILTCSTGSLSSPWFLTSPVREGTTARCRFRREVTSDPRVATTEQ